MNPHEHAKRKSMNAITHRDTTVMKRRFMRGHHAAPASPVAPPPNTSAFQTAVQQGATLVNNVKQVVQAGGLPLAAGAAVYAAHIRQVDSAARAQSHQRNGPAHWSQTKRDRTGREL